MPKFSPFSSVVSFFSGLLKTSPQKRTATLTAATGNAPARKLNAQQQQELGLLCQQLLKKSDLVASGRLQILGLQKIKKRIGKEWAGLQQIVYGTVETVIRKNIQKGDLYLRHGEETYLLIFADADLEESARRARQIAEEIQKRLFGIKRPELKELTIESDVRHTHASEIKGKDMNALAALMAKPSKDAPAPVSTAPPPATPKPAAKAPPPVKPIYVGADALEAQGAEQDAQVATYMPLWDVQNKALTTYLCLPPPEKEDQSPLDRYKELTVDAPYSARVQTDLYLLSAMRPTMEKMAEDGRKLFVICPVHYDTLYRQASFDQFIAACLAFPTAIKERFFFLLIVGLPDPLPAKDAFWFVPLLKNRVCRAIFAEILLENMPAMQTLKGSGIDALGISLPPHPVEAEFLPKINDFEKSIADSGISRSFILNVPSLSLVTTAVCAGMDYLGGSALHESVPEPNSMYRYKHEDLIAGLMPTT